MRLGVTRVEAQRLTIREDRFVQAAERLQRVAEAGLSIRVDRPQAKRRPGGGDGLVEPAEPFQREAPIACTSGSSGFRRNASSNAACA